MNQPTLTTKRLILRPFCVTDAEDVQRLAGEKAIADTTLSLPYPYKDGIAEGWIKSHAPKYKAGELVSFAVIESLSGNFVGTVSIGISLQFNRAELGYWFGVPFWNQGYCTEASSCLIDFAFNTLDIHRIVAYHLSRNPASGRVMEKIGMTKEGVLRDHIRKWGKYEDIVTYGILATDQQTKLANKT